jgi:ribonuclease J
MKQSTKLAQAIGYLPLPKNLIISEEQVRRFAANKICLIIAGSQGQDDSALSKVADNENKNVRINKGDKVVFSSDPIPGLEADVYDLIEKLFFLGANVIYSDVHDQLHASGHGNQEDLKFLIRFTNPKHLLPIGGTVRHQRQYLQIAKELGYRENQVVLLNEGDTYWF